MTTVWATRFFCNLALVLSVVAGGIASSQPAISIVPQPQSIELRNGTFRLTSSTSILCPAEQKSLGEYLANRIAFFTQLRPGLASRVRSRGHVISFVKDTTLGFVNPEEYLLDVSPETVSLRAGTDVGLFRGIQTLLQLIPLHDSTSNRELLIPSCRIKDYPRFAWRGLNLDCVRHFMTKEFVKRYIDLLAYYKFNVFHWHLTDDQGWRIQIQRYPKLTEVGAWRKDVGGRMYGGFYTQDEIREIVAYAKSRFITVVPEIEMPGHCEASLASYPENACIPGPFEVGTRWGVYKDIYCPAKESTFTFLENILSEVMALFPSPYIHIGGDEVPKDEWKSSALCQQRMKEEGLKSEEELQSYFIRRIQSFLKSHGRTMVGWDEILEGVGPDSGAVVESWRGTGGAVQAVKAGLRTIVSPGDYTYLSQDADGLSLDTVYSFDPMPQSLPADQQKLVLGTEASMWSEHAPQETVDGKMFPRLLAIAENAWTFPSSKNLTDFHRRLDRQYGNLSALGVDYGLEMKGITVHSSFDTTDGKFVVDLRAVQPGIGIRYAIGDTLTFNSSLPYSNPVLVEGGSTFIAQAELKGKLVGNPVVLSFITDKALNSNVAVSDSFSRRYSAGGINALVDGVRGTMNFRDRLWQGYEGVDLNAIIDLGTSKSITSVGAGFYQNSGSWIFMPDSVEFFVSEDSTHFETVGTIRNDVPQKTPDPVRKDFDISFARRSARYIRIFAKSVGVCPPWHPGAGGKAWIFVDELFAN